jgi:hypothetical protein
MPEIGYFLSSEEHGPAALVRQAQQAEQAGFFDFYRRELAPRLA